MKNDMTTGKPGKLLIGFIIPLFVSAVFQQLYTIFDSVIAGRAIGKDALAAVGVSYPITMIFMWQVRKKQRSKLKMRSI